MTLSSTLGMTAMSGQMAPQQDIGSAILAGLQASQSTDPGASALPRAVFGQAQEVSRLLASIQPNLGQNVNMTA